MRAISFVDLSLSAPTPFERTAAPALPPGLQGLPFSSFFSPLAKSEASRRMLVDRPSAPGLSPPRKDPRSEIARDRPSKATDGRPAS